MLNEYNRKDVSPLRYWVHAILPLVYDDCLSYYEVLAKVSEKMNEVISGLNRNNEQVEKVTHFTIEQVQNLTTAFNNFQESMLTRQSEFENTLLDEQHSFETRLDGEIAQWEENTTEHFNQIYQEFLSAYQRQFGVVQVFGNSTTDVISQEAISTGVYRMREQYIYNTPEEVDLNSLNLLGEYRFNNYTGNVLNKPDDLTENIFSVFTLGICQSGYLGAQILITAQTEKMFIRQHYGTTWYSWKRIVNRDDTKLFVQPHNTIITSLEQLPNFASALPNRIYLIGIADTIPDAPDGAHNGTLITFNHTTGNDAMIQIWCTDKGQMWTRNNFGVNKWNEWILANNKPVQNTGTDTKAIMSQAAISNFGYLEREQYKYDTPEEVDLNSLDLLGEYRFNNYTGSVLNKPDDLTENIFSVFTLGICQSGYLGAQILITAQTEKMFIRQHYGTTWYSWKRIVNRDDTNLFVQSHNAIITSLEQLPNFASALPNRIYLIGIADTIPDAPKGAHYGTLITFNHTTGNDAMMQIWCTDKGQMWARNNFGVDKWNEWKRLDNYLSLNENNAYTAFEKFGIIGDSLAVGAEQNPYNENAWTYNINARWGNILTYTDREVVYASTPGETTRGWLTNQTAGYPFASQPENICQAYIVGLGENDKYRLGADYLGTPDDIKTNPDENGDTYYGNYAKIIQKMKTLTPHSKFFLLTNPVGTDELSNSYNNAVRYIANNLSNCYLCDLEKDFGGLFRTGWISQMRRGGHYSAAAYAYMGKIILSEINNIIEQNPSAFYGVQFINKQ